MDRSCGGENADPRRSVRANAAMAAGTTYANASATTIERRKTSRPTRNPRAARPPLGFTTVRNDHGDEPSRNTAKAKMAAGISE